MKSVLNSSCADAKVSAMKIFLALMIFVMAFSGYSAASHAMGPDNCSSSQQMQGDSCPPDVQNSPDHAQKHDKSESGFCLDCAHCCAASVALPVTETWQPSLLSSVLNPFSEQFQPESRLFSLLRPPKTLA